VLDRALVALHKHFKKNNHPKALHVQATMSQLKRDASINTSASKPVKMKVDITTNFELQFRQEQRNKKLQRKEEAKSGKQTMKQLVDRRIKTRDYKVL
jgi:hypothetical protein